MTEVQTLAHPHLDTDIGQCEECMICERCGAVGPDATDGDSLCDNCAQNRADAAWERHCEDFHDGGSSWPMSLADQQAAARRLK